MKGTLRSAMDSESESSPSGPLWGGGDTPLIDLTSTEENFNLKFGNDYLLPAKPEDSVEEASSINVSSETASKSGQGVLLNRRKSPFHVVKTEGVQSKTFTIVLKRKLETPSLGQSKKVQRLEAGATTQVASSTVTAGSSSSASSSTQPSQQPAPPTDVDCDKLPCPFKRVPGSKPLIKGIMVNHKLLTEMNRKDINVCPLCIQKCTAPKEASYDMLMHVALHKGVQNLHCLCANCGRYVGRYMEKVATATNIINKETYKKLWLPKELKWMEVCMCPSPDREIVFDCVLDMKCYLNLVLLKMQKNPNLKIEIFPGANPFKDHLESHKQVWLASSLCELCREDPRYCHYRLFKGQYIALEEDMCLTSGFHQGVRVRDNSLYCRMIARRPQDEPATAASSEKEVHFSNQHMLLNDMQTKEAAADQSQTSSPKAKDPKLVVSSAYTTGVIPATAVASTSQQILKTSAAPYSVFSINSISKSRNNQYRTPSPPLLIKRPLTLPTPQKSALQSSVMHLDGLEIPFKPAFKYDQEFDIRASFPKLRCPAHKDGCRFACWHLKLMDAHIKAHLERVKLSVMFACMCNMYYHNLFDLFLHLQEKHGCAIKTDEEMSSFLCEMDECNFKEDEDEKKPEKSLNELLFPGPTPKVVVARFQSFPWINKLLVASGYIRKMMLPDSARTTWLECASDVENWIREETAGMNLYTGQVFQMRFEDVPFLDPYVTIDVIEMENDKDIMWAQEDDLDSESLPLREEDYAGGVPLDQQDQLEAAEDIRYKLESVSARNIPELHVLSPLISRAINICHYSVDSFKGVYRRPGNIIEKGRYYLNPSSIPALTYYRLSTQSEHRKVTGHEPTDEPFCVTKPLGKRKVNQQQVRSVKSGEQSPALLPKGYKLPPNVNRCQFAHITSISMASETGNTQVKIVQKDLDDGTFHQCPYCSQADTDIFQISQHMNKHHKAIQIMQDDMLNKKNLMMACRHCDFVTFSTFGCWLHLQHTHNAKIWPDAEQLHHPDYAVTGKFKGKKIHTFVCHECCRSMKSRRELITHAQIQSHDCQSIMMGYIKTKALTDEGAEDVFVCNFCPEVGVKAEKMKWHVCKEHGYPRLLFVCKYCTDYNTLYFTKALAFGHYTEYHMHCSPLWCSFTLVGDLDPKTFNQEPTKTRSKRPAPTATPAAMGQHQRMRESPKSHAGARLPVENDDLKLESALKSDLFTEVIKEEPGENGVCVGVEINSAGDVLQTFVMPLSGANDKNISTNATFKGEDSDDDVTFKADHIKIKDEPSDSCGLSGKNELRIEIKDGSVKTLSSDSPMTFSGASSPNTDLEEGEISLENVRAAAGIVTKNETPSETELPSGAETAEESVSVDDMVLVMASNGQQYYIPKEQLADILGDQL